MKADIGFGRRRLVAALAVGMVMLGTSASGQSMRIRPNWTAPLGSPVGTVGDTVASQFNGALGCWEVVVDAGTEVDLAIEATNWELAPGAPAIYSIAAVVDSSGYSNGIGGDLNPKGWPDSPTDGAYLAQNACLAGGNGDLCVPPFDLTCDGFTNGICIPNPDYIIPYSCSASWISAIRTGDLNYGWGQIGGDCDFISGGLYPDFAHLILEVPNDAAGTYVIGFIYDLDPFESPTFIGSQGNGLPIPIETFSPACITITNPNFEPPIRAPAPHDILKNRYISIDPRGAGQTNPSSHHIRLAVVSSEVNGQAGNGPWWAGQPNAACISVVTTTKPAVEPDWTGCDTAHLTGCAIIPTTTYSIRIGVDGELSNDNLLDTQARPGAKWYNDVVGFYDGIVWTAPNGVVNIDDAFAAIRTFQNPDATPGCDTPPCNATHTSVTDVHPQLTPESPNQLVNINDVFGILNGFQGWEFPGPDLTQCP